MRKKKISILLLFILFFINTVTADEESQGKDCFLRNILYEDSHSEQFIELS